MDMEKTNLELGLGTDGALLIREYLDAARRRKWTIILSAVGVFLASAVVAVRLPNIYRAETVVMVDPQQVPTSYVASTVSSSISDRLSTIQQQVLSPTRLQKLIDSMDLYPQLKGHHSEEEIIRMVQSSISIEVNFGGARMGAFKIAYSGKNPQQAARAANQLAALFIEENLKVRAEQSEGTANFLQRQLEDTKKNLEAKEQEVQAIKRRNVMDLPDSKQYHMEMLGNLRAQQQASQDRLSRAEQQRVYMQSMMVNSRPMVDLDTGFPGTNGSPRQGQIQKLESRLADLQARYGPKHPDVRRVQKDLDDLRKKEASEKTKAPPEPQIPVEAIAASARRNPVLESQISKLDEEVEGQNKIQKQLQLQIDFHASKLQQIPIFEQQIAGLMRDYDTLRSHYTNLLDKKLSADMASALENRQKAERFVVLDPALPPDKPFSPHRPLICLAGLFGGLLGGIGLAVLMEMGDESVRSEAEAVRIVGNPVLAGIPQLLTKQERRRKHLFAAGAVLGTVVGSMAVGLVISRIAALFS